MTWHNEVDILEKNVRDLQESLTMAHKRVATLAGIVTDKNVSLKAINEILEDGGWSRCSNRPVYRPHRCQRVALQAIKEIVSKEIVSL